MPASRSAPVGPTDVSRVEDALRAADDLLRVFDLCGLTGLPAKAVARSLWMLQHYRAVESLVEGGSTYWLATPENDSRLRHVEERRKEDEPRRTARPGRRG